MTILWLPSFKLSFSPCIGLARAIFCTGIWAMARSCGVVIDEHDGGVLDRWVM